MTIAFAKDVTENGGDFHTITVDDTHAGRLDDVMDTFERAGYEPVSVFIDGYDFQEDMWLKHIGYASNIVPLFNALCADSYSADAICAFITERDCADVEDWHDSIYFSGTDYESVVREWAEIGHKVYEETASDHYRSDYVSTDPFPSWMELDWEETLNNIAREESSSVVEFAGMVYYFG